MSSFEPRHYKPPDALLADRVILITGASGALGQALALACAKLGATVLMHGRNRSVLEKLYDEILAAGGAQPALAPLDLATALASDYDALAEVIDKEFGRLDGLVHAAALLGDRSPIDQYDVPTWCRVMHVDATAPFILTQVLLPLLRKSSDASIISVSSGVALDPKPFWGAYAVAKAALHSFTLMLARELDAELSIRINSVNPGRLRSPMRAAAYPGENASTLPLPESVLPSFLYFLGRDSRGITAQTIECQPPSSLPGSA
jgi:NAD(P)-dependent dehydrogenase (short-subunit alcohol dehydrogenase family)